MHAKRPVFAGTPHILLSQTARTCAHGREPSAVTGRLAITRQKVIAKRPVIANGPLPNILLSWTALSATRGCARPPEGRRARQTSCFCGRERQHATIRQSRHRAKTVTSLSEDSHLNGRRQSVPPARPRCISSLFFFSRKIYDTFAVRSFVPLLCVPPSEGLQGYLAHKKHSPP